MALRFCQYPYLEVKVLESLDQQIWVKGRTPEGEWFHTFHYWLISVPNNNNPSLGSIAADMDS